MRLMRYFGVYCVQTILLALAGLIVIMLAIVLIENAGTLSRLDTRVGLTILYLVIYNFITYSFQVLPIAVLLGVLLAATQLARRGEFLAVQAAGMHVARLWATFWLVSTLFVGLNITSGEYFVPWATRQIEQLQHKHLGKTLLSLSYSQRTKWFKEANLLLYLPDLDVKKEIFLVPTVYRLNQGLVEYMLEAKALSYEAGSWRLQQVREIQIATGIIQDIAEMRLPLKVSARDLIDSTGDPRQMSFRELWELIKRREKASFDTTVYRLELYNRLAFPLTAWWLVSLILWWVTLPSRKRSLAVALGIGVVLIALELALAQLFRLSALAHKLTPFWGAFGIGLVCLTLLPFNWLLYRRYLAKGYIWFHRAS